MDNNIRIAVDTLDYAIKQLTEQRNSLLAKVPLTNRTVTGTWVIKKNENKYYMVHRFHPNNIVLSRNGDNEPFDYEYFNKNFRIAEQWEIEQHLIFIENKTKRKEQQTKPQLPEFYMITVKGERGATVRHESLEIAVKEATRLAKKTEHRAHILGVVGIIEPTIVQQPILEYQFIK